MKLELLTYEKENLPRGWKPYYIYLIMVDHIEVGRIVLREGSNEERYYDGHIGYTIEKEYRGHHYILPKCKSAKCINFIIPPNPNNIFFLYNHLDQNLSSNMQVLLLFQDT